MASLEHVSCDRKDRNLPRLPIGAHRCTSLIKALRYGSEGSSAQLGILLKPTIRSSSVSDDVSTISARRVQHYQPS